MIMTYLIAQFSWIQGARARFLCGAIIVASLCGCASRPDSRSAYDTSGEEDQTSFAAGIGRPPSATTSYSLAKILISQGRDRDAIFVLSRVIRDNPGFIRAYNEIAGVYFRSDRLDDAIDVLLSGLEQAPNDPVLQN